mmetsp:Transcript_108664/g.150278  ORF Transcript_108664/g.150278 Transcript_108664/m.150278 type:complete len:99 (-) Transcript_108664:85-381(-)
MARSSTVLVAAVCFAALFALSYVAAPAFVPAPATSLRATANLDKAAQAAVLSAVVATPQMAHAGTAGYAVLQLGWAVFIISLGPAVLFWIYFNKPELL